MAGAAVGGSQAENCKWASCLRDSTCGYSRIGRLPGVAAQASRLGAWFVVTILNTGGFDVMTLLRLLRASISAAAIFASLGAVGCSPIGGVKITAVPSDLSLKERVVFRHPGWVSDRIAVLDISGVLMNAHSPGFLSEGSTGFR